MTKTFKKHHLSSYHDIIAWRSSLSQDRGCEGERCGIRRFRKDEKLQTQAASDSGRGKTMSNLLSHGWTDVFWRQMFGGFCDCFAKDGKRGGLPSRRFDDQRNNLMIASHLFFILLPC